METSIKLFSPLKSTLMQQCSAFSVQWYFKRDIKDRLYTIEEKRNGDNVKKFHSLKEDLQPHRTEDRQIINHSYSYDHYKKLILNYWRKDKIDRAILYENFTGNKLFQFNGNGLTEINSIPIFGQANNGNIFLEDVQMNGIKIEIPVDRVKYYYNLRKQNGLI